MRQKQWYKITIETHDGKEIVTERYTAWSINQVTTYYWKKKYTLTVNVKVI